MDFFKKIPVRYFAELSFLNFRLYAELKEAVEDHLESLPVVPPGTDIPGDEEIVRNHQEQLQLMKQVCEMKHFYSFISLCLGRLGEAVLFLGSEFICTSSLRLY